MTTISMDDYVADRVGAPCPTLNSSVAYKLISRSPLHAWAAHPKLNPAREPETSDAFDLGTAVHALLLECRDIIEVCAFDDWRTKDAKNMRDIARQDGKIPLLPHQAELVRRMAGVGRKAMDTCPDLRGCGPYDPEQTIVYRYEDTWLRCRPDLIAQDKLVVLSYKTAQSAEPEKFTRSLLDYGYEMQAAFEINAVESLTGVRPKYVWVVQESAEPYAVSFVGMSPGMHEYAQERFESAVGVWADCLERNEWPGYPERVHWVDLPGYLQTRWEEAKAIQEIVEVFA